jgi:spermidine synthase
MNEGRWVLFLLSCGSGVSALIYEIVWFQLLELVIGASAVSLGVILATFMGGTCFGSLLFPRLITTKHNPLRVYAVIELGIGVLGILVLLLMPLAAGVYTAWSGDGWRGFLLRGVIAGGCLLPPTLLMGATLPALARSVEATPDGVSWLGFFYGGNIAGAVFGCLLSGFYLLREYDVATATYVAAAINAAVAGIAFVLSLLAPRLDGAARGEVRAEQTDSGEPAVYIAIALSGLCALAAETVWTRMLGLLLGNSVYTFSIILAAFLAGLGMGSGIGSLLSRSLARPRLALGWCQLLVAGAIAWTAYSLSASLPYWPIDPSISSNVWFTFQVDLDRTFWALLPPTLLWGASFPLALAAIAQSGRESARLVAGVYAANTVGAIAGALGTSLLLITRMGSQRVEQWLIALSTAAGLLLLLQGIRWAGVVPGIVAVLLAGLLINSVPPLAKVLVAHGRYAATWAGKSDIIYAEEGMNASVAVSRFPNGVLTYHVAGKIQASSVPRDMRLQRMLGHLAGTGLDLDESAAIYADMLAYRRFPEDLFAGTEGRVESLWKIIEAGGQ